MNDLKNIFVVSTIHQTDKKFEIIQIDPQILRVLLLQIFFLDFANYGYTNYMLIRY